MSLWLALKTSMFNDLFGSQKLQEKTEVQARTVASLEERCASLKATIDQLNLGLERAASGEGELRAEVQELRRSLLDTSSSSQASSEKLKQVGFSDQLQCDDQSFANTGSS